MLTNSRFCNGIRFALRQLASYLCSTARDFFHNSVKVALEEDGWKITHDPYQLSVLGVDYDIDLGAEKIIAAEKGSERIAIQVKSFMGFSFPYEFHQAVGQYTDYG